MPEKKKMSWLDLIQWLGLCVAVLSFTFWSGYRLRPWIDSLSIVVADPTYIKDLIAEFDKIRKEKKKAAGGTSKLFLATPNFILGGWDPPAQYQQMPLQARAAVVQQEAINFFEKAKVKLSVGEDVCFAVFGGGNEEPVEIPREMIPDFWIISGRKENGKWYQRFLDPDGEMAPGKIFTANTYLNLRKLQSDGDISWVEHGRVSPGVVLRVLEVKETTRDRVFVKVSFQIPEEWYNEQEQKRQEEKRDGQEDEKEVGEGRDEGNQSQGNPGASGSPSGP